MPKTLRNISYFKKYAYIGISHVEPVKSQTLKCTEFADCVIKPISPGTYHLPATHRIILMQRNWKDSYSTSRFDAHTNKIIGTDFSHPEQEVGIVIWTRRSIFDRHPGGKFIFYNDYFYHILTWTDVLGSRHHKQSALQYYSNNQLILFGQQRTEEECKSLAEMFQSENVEFIAS